MPNPRRPRVDDVFLQVVTSAGHGDGTRTHGDGTRTWVVERVDAVYAEARIRCTEATRPADEWAGRATNVSLVWVASHLVDPATYEPPAPPVPAYVDPPCGRGTQAAHVLGVFPDGSAEESRILCFDDATVMISHLENFCERFETAAVKWWGWEPDSTDEPADMIGTWAEGSLNWLEGVS